MIQTVGTSCFVGGNNAGNVSLCSSQRLPASTNTTTPIGVHYHRYQPPLPQVGCALMVCQTPRRAGNAFISAGSLQDLETVLEVRLLDPSKYLAGHLDTSNSTVDTSRAELAMSLSSESIHRAIGPRLPDARQISRPANAAYTASTFTHPTVLCFACTGFSAAVMPINRRTSHSSNRASSGIPSRILWRGLNGCGGRRLGCIRA